MARLENDLKYCCINFDHPVLITDILATYDLKYFEATEILLRFLYDQESRVGIKYQKSFVVHGEDSKGDSSKEIYKIVEESELQEWLGRLQKVQSSLYSVEVVGSAPYPAPTFQPIPIANNVKLRHNIQSITKDCVVSVNITQSDVKPNKSQSPVKTKVAKKQKIKSPKDESVAKTNMNNQEMSTVKKEVPSGHKTVNGSSKFEKKKIITQFFNNATVLKSSVDGSAVKNADRSAVDNKISLVKEAINTSIHVFDGDVELNKSDESDNEENLDILRICAFSEEKEMEIEKSSVTHRLKRRRICDSDLEDEMITPAYTPPKLADNLAGTTKCENFVDSDGYFHTFRLNVKKTSSHSPPSKKKVKVSPRKPIIATRTKQSGIQNYFLKK